MTLARKIGLGAAGLVLLVVGSIAVSAWRKWSAKQDAAMEHRYLSAKEEAASLRLRYDSVVKASKIDSTRLDSLKAQSAVLQKQIDSRADSARLRAVQNDALGIPESPTDPRWQKKFYLAKQEITDLTAEVDLLTRLHLNDTTQLLITAVQSKAWEGIASTAMLSVVPNLVSVATEQHDRQDCAILRFIPCPSRKVAMATGTALGAVVVLVLQHVKKVP